MVDGVPWPVAQAETSDDVTTGKFVLIIFSGSPK